MSETDIYKNREPLPYGNKRPKRSTRRRSDSPRAFDDHSRKRRSKNSGLRRLVHLYRKKENEKVVWWTLLVSVVVILTVLAVWQFWIRELIIRSQNEKMQYTQPQLEFPEAPASAAE